MRKLLQSAESKTNPAQLQRTTRFLSGPLFWPIRTRESTTESASNCALAKNTAMTIRLATDLGNSEDESHVKIVSLPDSESGQHWTRTPHIQFYMPRLSKHGNPKRGLGRIILGQRLCHMAINVLTTAMCKCIIIRPFSMTQTWTLFKLSDQGYRPYS